MLLAVKEPEGSAPSGRRERHDTAATYAADGAADGGHGAADPMARATLTHQTEADTAWFVAVGQTNAVVDFLCV